MNIDVVHGKCILDKKLLRCFRIMGIIVHQSFNKNAVFNVDDFIFCQGQDELVEINIAPFTLEFIYPDIAFIENGISHPALAQEITAGYGRMLEMKVKGMIRSDPVKGIKLTHLIKGDELNGKWTHIKIQLTEVNVHPLHNSTKKFAQLFHSIS
jgi:hypothetical protein